MKLTKTDNGDNMLANIPLVERKQSEVMINIKVAIRAFNSRGLGWSRNEYSPNANMTVAEHKRFAIAKVHSIRGAEYHGQSIPAELVDEVREHIAALERAGKVDVAEGISKEARLLGCFRPEKPRVASSGTGVHHPMVA